MTSPTCVGHVILICEQSRHLIFQLNLVKISEIERTLVRIWFEFLAISLKLYKCWKLSVYRASTNSLSVVHVDTNLAFGRQYLWGLGLGGSFSSSRS